MSNAEITLITILCEHIKGLVDDEEAIEIEHWLTRVKEEVLERVKKGWV